MPGNNYAQLYQVKSQYFFPINDSIISHSICFQTFVFFQKRDISHCFSYLICFVINAFI